MPPPTNKPSAEGDGVAVLREGDVYRWYYKKPPEHMPYHCKSCIGIVNQNGVLVDTFWGYGSDNVAFWPDQIPFLDLTYLGNMTDLEKSSEWNADYYADADIVNLNHSNNSRGNFYIRKGAKKSTEKMREIALYRIEKERSNIRSAQHSIEWLEQSLAAIERGETDGVHL